MSELEQVRQDIRKQRGEDKVMKGSDPPNTCYIPTGIFMLDLAMLGGLPDGRGTMIYGVESSGKSTVGYLSLISAQRKYPESVVVLLDFEHMYEEQWFTTLGGDPDRLELIQPEFGEEGIDIAMAYIDAEEVSALMVDSIASIVPKKMDERSVEDYGTGERARLAGLMCSKILNSWGRERKRGHKCTVIMINQYRDDIGKMMGDPRKLPGGWQVNYFCKTRFQMKCAKKAGEDSRGIKIPDHNLHTFRMTKDKGASIQTAEFKINLNPDHPRGLPVGAVDEMAQVGTYAKRIGLITGGGQSWKLEGVEAMTEPDKDPKKAKQYSPLWSNTEAGMSEEEWSYALANWPRKEWRFQRLTEIEDFLYDHPEELLRLKQQIIADVRATIGMQPLPPDGYLLDWCEGEED